MKQNIGFIGTGVMGHSIAQHLLNAGHNLHLYTRTRQKAQSLLDSGAIWVDSPAALTQTSDVIFTIVGFPQDVESIYFNTNGLIPHLRPNMVLVDMTTSSPDLARRIAAAAVEQQAIALDAPVSGGDKGAREATLSIMVGGDEPTFKRLLPLLRLLGCNIVYHGPAGSGQHCKLCNQIAITGTMIGLCESLAYARKSGLEPNHVLQSIASGAAGSWSLSNLAPRILNNDFSPGFFVKHFIKDMEIAAASATALNLDTPGLKLALELYQQLAAAGYGDNGTQALYKLYDDV